MKTYIHLGWNWLKEHVYIWVILFLYQLLWSFFVYQFINKVVWSVLRRYPNPGPTELSSKLFFIESHFHLSKTNDYAPYLWLFIGCIVIRMLLTPFIEAGMLYAIAQPGRAGLTFFRGMITVWKPMLLLYITKIVLLLASAYWFIPYAVHIWTTKSTVPSVLITVIPYFLMWVIGGWIVSHLFLFMQFGIAAEWSLLRSIKTGMQRIFPILGLSLMFTGVILFISLLFATGSLLWTGMIALTLQQAFPAVRTICTMWRLSAQYALWHEASQQTK